MAPDLMTARLAEWASAGRAKTGETDSGDRSVAVEFDDGLTVAVVDGLGHGPEAADAAERALEVVRERPDRPLEWVIRECHEALHRTRGAVMAIVSIRPERSAWVGVGNIEGRVLRPGLEPLAPVTLPQLGGIVGYQLPPLHASPLRLQPNDLIVLATDGIGLEFKPDLRPAKPVQEIADGLLENFGKAIDDAMVVVVRYLGGD